MTNPAPGEPRGLDHTHEQDEPMKTKFTHLTEDGQVFTRSTETMAYTHVGLVFYPANIDHLPEERKGKWRVVGWSASARGAENLAAREARYLKLRFKSEPINGGSREGMVA